MKDTTDLKLLEVLITERDYNFIMSLLSDESITRGALCECGDILITNMRNYGRVANEI